MNDCYLKVTGARDGAREAFLEDTRDLGYVWSVRRYRHSASRPNETQTRQIKDWVIMHSAPMVAVRNHLLLGCPRCQPGVIMMMYAARAKKIGYVNRDVLLLARQVNKGRPTRLTKKALEILLTLKAIQEVHRT